MVKLKYLALLRGINVGGKNIIKMDELKKIIDTPIYQNITIRNWNTTKKLYELMGINNE